MENPEQWQKVKQIVGSVLEKLPEQRAESRIFKRLLQGAPPGKSPLEFGVWMWDDRRQQEVCAYDAR